MNRERLIALNRYTRLDIEEFTGKRPENPTVVFAGNTLMMRQLRANILAKVPSTIRGSGKLTAVLSICDELDLKYRYDIDGSLFDRLPFMNDEIVYITRDPGIKSKLLKEYLNTPIALCILDSGNISYCDQVITLRSPSDLHDQEEKEEQMVAKHLKSGNISPLPENTHLWIARAFPDNLQILEICDLADQTDNPLYYESLMRLVKCKKSIKLVYPKWLKVK